ncbi:hypothetical protein [Streptomyces sp. NBC_01474]|uniref:hypothetical protein n=1 Tax=unclassified Streptomyces TaxID=2593676 RepID=UPI002DD86C49|nr:hypothetical protein [Streptomyces sp. NBC_01474]
MSRVAMRSEIERICEIIDDTIRRAPRRGTGPAALNCSDRVSWLMRRTGPVAGRIPTPRRLPKAPDGTSTARGAPVRTGSPQCLRDLGFPLASPL